jgi:acyl dehydratase
MIGKTIADLQPGDHAELVRTVGTAAIAAFVDAVGDYNPIHSDPGYALSTPFREPIAPGIFTAGLISAVIGTELPGPGAIYLSQSLKFVKPVRAGDTITARVEVIEVIRERNRIRLSTVCRNQNGEEVLSGEAWVLPSRTAVAYERPARVPSLASLAVQPWAWAAETAAMWASLGRSLCSVRLARRG